MTEDVTRTTTRTPAGDDARRRLLEAATAAFATKGFHGTTTRDIAAAAGMSPAALYVHHRSKEELLHVLSSAGHERTLALLREARDAYAPPVGGPTAQLRAMMHAYVLHHAREHTRVRIVNYELASLSDEHRAEVGAVRRAIQDTVLGVVRAGVTAGEFDTPDPSLTTSALMSLGIDVARWFDDAKSATGGATPEDVADHHTRLALRMVGAG